MLRSHREMKIIMSLLVILMLNGLVSVWSQSTLLDSQCDYECRNDVELQSLVAMMENMRRDMKKMDTRIKLLESEVQNQNGTINQLKAEISDLKSKNQTSNVDGSMNYDCEDLRARGYLYSGVYEVNVNIVEKRRVYCEMTSDSKAWTRILHRQDNLTDFTYKKWAEYEAGFGDPQGSHWMGLVQMNQLTTGRDYKLRVDLEDWEGATRYAEYSTFSVGAGSDKYRLRISGYSGTAGDSMTTAHNNKMFTTIDQDNDQSRGHCADGTNSRTGGWWYSACALARLTGPYFQGGDVPANHGIEWEGWRGNTYSYKVATMKVQRL